ncbi:hypothetical protein HNR42_001289 [Deinobacterium chartae]|uniref:Uncharacterized protein n=1 Tax=Deinobacterium chartae TaxID=521158 RepID=A0A841HY96_9DEIO|nr:hypothetical protein [Deinobacterium chartae]MBB6097866.1 hypothetical protein [Deinobacterium chartae]
MSDSDYTLEQRPYLLWFLPLVPAIVLWAAYENLAPWPLLIVFAAALAYTLWLAAQAPLERIVLDPESGSLTLEKRTLFTRQVRQFSLLEAESARLQARESPEGPDVHRAVLVLYSGAIVPLYEEFGPLGRNQRELVTRINHYLSAVQRPGGSLDRLDLN